MADKEAIFSEVKFPEFLVSFGGIIIQGCQGEYRIVQESSGGVGVSARENCFIQKYYLL